MRQQVGEGALEGLDDVLHSGLVRLFLALCVLELAVDVAVLGLAQQITHNSLPHRQQEVG